MELQPITLAGYAYYASVHQPQRDKEFGDKYKLDLMLEDENGNPFIYENPQTGEKIDMVKFVEELGLEIKNASKHIPGRYLTIRSKATYVDKKTGAVVERDPIPVANADKELIKDLIGNGSKVRVRAMVGEYTYGRNRGVSVFLDKVIVDELVPYTGKNSDPAWDFQVEPTKGKKDDVPFDM